MDAIFKFLFKTQVTLKTLCFKTTIKTGNI